MVTFRTDDPRRDELERLRREKAELLSACRKVLHGSEGNAMELHRALARLRLVLEKVERGTV